MSSLNKVTLIGNLGSDPETREIGNGKLTSFRLATTDVYKTREGDRKEATEWHNIVIFNERIIDVAERFLKKGSQVYLEGKLKTRKWVDKDGNDRLVTEVVVEKYTGELKLLGRAEGGNDTGRGNARNDDRRDDRRDERDRGDQRGGNSRFEEDEIPF